MTTVEIWGSEVHSLFTPAPLILSFEGITREYEAGTTLIVNFAERLWLSRLAARLKGQC